MLCDRDRSEKLFLFDTDPHRLTMSDSSRGSPRCARLWARRCAHPVHCVTHSAGLVYTHTMALSSTAVVMVGKGHMWPGASQNGGGLPTLTKGRDQTKNQRVLHVEHPTNPYRILCSRSECHWGIRFGLPTLTTLPFWPDHRYKIVLPCLTGRGVKYTHNDHEHLILHHHSGPRGIRPIPQASTQEVIVIVVGGAQHRSMDPHTIGRVTRSRIRRSSPHDHIVLGVRCIFCNRR
jgi:hypothetical protein